METVVHEIADNIFRLSTYVQPANFTFNQYLVRADQPLLFHAGPRAMFPLIADAMAQVMPVAKLRWIAFGHHESDESGAMNQWLAAAPQSSVLAGEIGCMISLNDLCDRPPQSVKDDASIDLGGKRVRYLATPHVPHGWDAGVIFEETTQTLLCGDLFTAIGKHAPRTSSDIVGPALAAEDVFHATALTPQTAPTIHKLGELKPTTLALMHGSAFDGDCAAALAALADGYAQRVEKAF
jgi:flavorubredoxin